MRSAPDGRSAILIKSVLTVLALGSVAHRSAEASCSHYVQAHSDLPSYESSLALFDSSRSPSETTAPLAPLGSQPRRPCSGALCSGQPASPLSPAQIDVPRAGQWAIIAATIQEAVPGPAFCQLVEVVLLPGQCSTSVYHPPRP